MLFTKRTLWYSKKGISTIIATIIIVSVSIVMAIAVAYWAMGLGQSFQKFEKVEFTSAYAEYYPPSSGATIPANFTVYIVLKNTGTATATMANIFLNGKPYETGYTGVTQENLVNQTLAVGKSTVGAKIFLPDTSDWGHGNTVEVSIQSAAGRSSSYTIVLP